MSKQCTTHHHACDCREEKFKQLEQENAALRADKERLISVLEEMLFQFQTYSRIDMEHAACGEARAAIDAARKEAQP